MSFHKVRLNGYSKRENLKRNISKSITKSLLQKYNCCLHCSKPNGGSNGGSRLCIDHKNDLYNDKRVMNIKTQTIDDFQVLCQHCNNSLKHHIAHNHLINQNTPYPWEMNQYLQTGDYVDNPNFLIGTYVLV